MSRARQTEFLSGGEEFGTRRKILPFQADAKLRWFIGSKTIDTVVVSFAEHWLEDEKEI